MAIFDIFSKRQARLRGEVPDVYRYDAVPQILRVQIVHILRDLLHGGRDENLGPYSMALHAYEKIHHQLCREYGVFRLHEGPYGPLVHVDEFFRFILEAKNHEHVLDAVEIAARYADFETRSLDYLDERNFDQRVDHGIAELNQRFKEHGIGYQYEAGQLVRVDSGLLHANAVKPALTLLGTKGYGGPREEFLRAYEHYKHGRHEEALTEALKSFESTMKSICDIKRWTYDKGISAKKLVDVCFKNGLIDPFWQTHLSHLQGTLENGISTARNQLGAHGQGSRPRQVPREIVAYVLHMTASTIVFLIESATK